MYIIRLIRLNIKNKIFYIVPSLLSLINPILIMLIQISLWSHVNTEYIFYFVTCTIFTLLIPSGNDRWFTNAYIGGSICFDIMRPASILFHAYARSLSAFASNVLMYIIPIIFFFAWKEKSIYALHDTAYMLCAVFFSFNLFFVINALVNLSIIGLENNDGIIHANTFFIGSQ